MSGFSAQWLALREPCDARARAADITAKLAQVVRSNEALRVVDLGTGTGSNFRALAPHLTAAREWILVDHDARLLETIRRDRDGVTLRQLNLAAELEALDLSGVQVVTASALLDLVSQQWLNALLQRCSALDITLLFTLTYDGRMELLPPELEDERVRELVNAHQLSDKGFGAALGPHATAHACELLEDFGYRVERKDSDWQLGNADAQLQRELIAGWVDAVIEMAPAEATSLRSWIERRMHHVDAGRSRILVGHQDLLAWKDQLG